MLQNFARAASRAALLSFMAALVLGLFACAGEATMKTERLTLVTSAGEKVIDIEVAMTPDEKSKGLMFRTALADTAGMLFPYDGQPQDITMWMKNTYIPLDMVFIRADGVIHRIEVKTEPLSEKVIAAGAPVTGVLELAGGAAERLGIKAGDRVLHPHFKPRK
jgi:uncharacterized protein